MAFAGGNPIAAILAARAGGGAPGGPQGAPGVQGGGGQDDAQGLVDQAAQLINRAVQVEKDPVERAGLSKVLALLHNFAATAQKQQDAAMGAGPAVQLLRRQQGQ
jgi:hypothetical protein